MNKGRPKKPVAELKRGRGRPAKAVNYPLEVRTRAKLIYQQSLGKATFNAICDQLTEEGFKPVPKDTLLLRTWRKADEWDTPFQFPKAAELSEDMRQAVQLRVPDDLQRIERSADRFEILTQIAADHLGHIIKNVKVETATDFAIMTRCACDLLNTTAAAAKSVQDLRLLRISSLSGDGELIPPKKAGDERAPEPAMMSEQERVLSNFEGK